MAESKNCIMCWILFYKKPTRSKKDWIEKTTCCSVECSIKKLKNTQLETAKKRKWIRFTEEQKKASYLFKPWHTSDPTWENLKKYRNNWWITWNKWLKWFRSWEVSNFRKWWAMKTRPLKIQIRESREMERWTKEVFERDNYTCQKCWIRSWKWVGRVKLQAHHLKAFSTILIQYNIQSFEEAMSCKELWDILNWQTLCKDCHIKTDSYKRNQFTGLWV